MKVSGLNINNFLIQTKIFMTKQSRVRSSPTFSKHPIMVTASKIQRKRSPIRFILEGCVNKFSMEHTITKITCHCTKDGSENRYVLPNAQHTSLKSLVEWEVQRVMSSALALKSPGAVAKVSRILSLFVIWVQLAICWHRGGWYSTFPVVLVTFVISWTHNIR